ncbi:hypothetical protein BUE76_22330 [Cnuella takakiae]|nr:hypothetical protein BUE76_22330 [Cnuella takakiae]
MVYLDDFRKKEAKNHLFSLPGKIPDLPFKPLSAGRKTESTTGPINKYFVRHTESIKYNQFDKIVFKKKCSTKPTLNNFWH